jgi:hypothetical protein
MALELNGTTGVSLVQDGVVSTDDLANGAVTAGKLASTLDLTGKTVTLPAGTIVIPNYNYAQLNGTPSFTAAQSTWQDSGLSVTITPQFTSSRILILCQFAIYLENSVSADSNGRVMRSIGGGGYTTINPNTNPVSGSSEAGAVAGNLRDAASIRGYMNTWHTLDHPNTTSSITYKLQVIGEVNFFLNRPAQTGATRFGAPPSMISVLEVLD